MTDATFSGGVTESLAVWGPEGSDFYNYTLALGQMFDQIASIVFDQGSPDDPENYTAGWSNLLSLDTPYPTYTGMFVGVVIPPGTDNSTARMLLAQEQGFVRGNPSAIVSAAQRFLSGSQSCQLAERVALDGSPDAYHFLLQVRPEEVLNVDSLIAAVNGVKPAGVQWDLIQSDGTTWATETSTWAADTKTWAQKG